jgi:outer membrane protein TolC
VLNVSASLVQTLLDNGQRFRNLETQRLNLENALANYRKAVIGAFNDIEVQLGNIQSLQEQLAVAQRNLEAAEEAFRLSEVRYREGVTDYQTVLNSQNSLFATRNAFLNAKLGQLNAVVDFYQALGGGWEMPQ